MPHKKKKRKKKASLPPTQAAAETLKSPGASGEKTQSTREGGWSKEVIVGVLGLPFLALAVIVPCIVPEVRAEVGLDPEQEVKPPKIVAMSNGTLPPRIDKLFRESQPLKKTKERIPKRPKVEKSAPSPAPVPLPELPSTPRRRPSVVQPLPGVEPAEERQLRTVMLDYELPGKQHRTITAGKRVAGTLEDVDNALNHMFPESQGVIKARGNGRLSEKIGDEIDRSVDRLNLGTAGWNILVVISALIGLAFLVMYFKVRKKGSA